MDPQTQQIIDLLNQGKFFREIQKILNVSPNKISDAKKDYPDLINIPDNNNAIATGNGNATDIGKGNKNDDIESNFPNSRKNSIPNNANDSETLLKMKREQLAHEVKLKEMDNQEKEKVRQFEREKHEREIREKQIEEGKDTAIQKLREENWKLKNDLTRINEEPLADEELSDQDSEDDYEDEEPESIDPEFYDDIRKFASALLKKDGCKMEEDEVKSTLVKIKILKKRFKAMCDDDETDYKDFTDWDILSEPEKYLKNMLKDFGFWTSRVEFIFSDEAKKDWSEFLKED